MCIFWFLKKPGNKLNMHFLFVWSFWQTASHFWVAVKIQTQKKITEMEEGGDYDSLKATPWKQSLQPTSATPNHNSHKHNWNFIECKTTGSIQVFRNYYLGSQSSLFKALREIYDHLLFFFNFVHSRPLSLCVRTLSHGKMCTLLPTVSPNGCLQLAFNERKQQERLYSKTETDGANKVLSVQLAWLLTVPLSR